MAFTIKDLEAKVTSLQQIVDNEQLEIAALLAQKDAAILSLQEINATLVVEGGTEAERQAIADKIDLVISDLQSTVVVETPPVEEG